MESPGSALLSWRDLRSTPDRRSPVSCFSFSDRVSVPDRRSFETRLSSPDRFSSLPIVVSVGLPRIMLDRVTLPHESRPGGGSLVPAMSARRPNLIDPSLTPAATRARASIHRTHHVEFCRRWALLLTTAAPAMRGAFALWTRTCCVVQNLPAQGSNPDDDYRFPSPCL